MNCPFCKAPMEEDEMDYILEHDGQQLKLEGVPTWVCTQCDHTIVTDEVGEAIEDMLDHLDTVQEDADED